MKPAFLRGTSTLALVAALVLSTAPAPAKQNRTEPAAAPAETAKPWMNKALPAQDRANLLLKEMTQDEKLTLIKGYAGFPFFNVAKPAEAVGSAGYVPGIPRLGIPALQETDASLGIANPGNVRPNAYATPLPSGLATAASFNPTVAYDGGAMIGQEAWRQGFNVLLAGGVNLARDPRNGRNFEYLGEDPLLAGELDGASIRGIQDQHVISTIKHYAINDQETARNWANAVIDEAAMRESDLLAFEIAIEKGRPGSVMCSYNLINGEYGCGNKHLLSDILKRDWAWPGFVMSDWGAVHNVSYANAGLDQQAAASFDFKPFFGDILKAELAKGAFPEARLTDMAGRIVRAMFEVGAFDNPPVRSPIDVKASGEVALRSAEQGIVLIKNDKALLPLAAGAKRIAIIGGYAANGVISGGGSSQVIPENALTVPMGGNDMAFMSNMVVHPSSPMKAIKALAPGAEVRFDDGRYTASAEKLAKWADVVIVFGVKWMTEGADSPDLTLPDRQDDLIAAVGTANRKTIVVLETGGPVLMPWLDKVGAVVEAWYPGARGGEAIANVLFGKINPSGRLPVTFPKGLDQNPRPIIPGLDAPEQQFVVGASPASIKPIDVVYTEGSDVGYRWFAKKKLKPLFPFGFGLSYTTFKYQDLTVEGGSTLTVSFDVTNTGSVAGTDVPQVYLTSAADVSLLRLIGFSKVQLAPGQTQHVSVRADPQLLAGFDTNAPGWRIKAGIYRIAVGHSAVDNVLTGATPVEASIVKP
jgi:beta-glucosidase